MAPPLNPNAPLYNPIAAAATQSPNCYFTQLNNSSNYYCNFDLSISYAAGPFPNPPLFPIIFPPPPAFCQHIYDQPNPNSNLIHIPNLNPSHAPNNFYGTNFIPSNTAALEQLMRANNCKEENNSEEVIKQVITRKEEEKGAAEAEAAAIAETSQVTAGGLFSSAGSSSGPYYSFRTPPVKEYSWKPKGRRHGRNHDRNRKPTCPSVCFDFEGRDADISNGDGRTTVMIKNIPNMFDKTKMLELLDEHCLKINQSLLRQTDDDHQGDHDASSPFSEFDFLYLPVDFKTSHNLGYAFVNFTTPIGAQRLYCELHYKSWADHGSGKVCEVTYARIQGLARLVGHFCKSIFCCETKEYLPVHFTPSRGFSALCNQHYVGKYIPRPKRT